MATQKPISTISYNTEAFLREKLEAWKNAHIIQAYQYICHKGEDGDKDHIHLRVEPNKKLDPMCLQDELKEYEQGKEKPLGCRPWRPSKEEDWILYAVHDPKYLKLKYGGGDKGEKIPYEWQKINVPDDYDMEIAFIRAKATLNHTSENLATRIQNGDKPLSMILEGENPYMVNALMRACTSSDYQRLAQENSQLKEDFENLYNAILDYGLFAKKDENGCYFLTDEEASTESHKTKMVKLIVNGKVQDYPEDFFDPE